MVSMLLLSLMTLNQVNEVEGRYVTRASRNLVRHIRRRMERTYGLGLTGLIHPVTKAFNHEAVIRQRGGRKENEVVGNTYDMGLHHVLGFFHRMVSQENPTYFEEIEGKQFDRYDQVSFVYGWIVALHADPDTMTSSNCFLAAFEAVTQIDYLMADWAIVDETKNYFNVFVYGPQHIQGNLAASYEYCNLYIYATQLSYIFQFDYGYLSELGTRYSMLLSTEAEPFLTDIYALLAEEPTDWYLVGMRWGLLWQIMFDVKLES